MKLQVKTKTGTYSVVLFDEPVIAIVYDSDNLPVKHYNKTTLSKIMDDIEEIFGERVESIK